MVKRRKIPQNQTLTLTFTLPLIDIKLGIHHVFHMYNDMASDLIEDSKFLNYQRYHITNPNTIKDKRIKPKAADDYFKARDLREIPICDGHNDYQQYVKALTLLVQSVDGLRKFARPGSALLEPRVDKFLEEVKALVSACRLTDGENTLF